MNRIYGKTLAKVDEKGRVFFPASFRKQLADAGEGERLLMRKDVFKDCLTIYPESSWNARVDELSQRLNRWNERHQEVFRAFVAEVEWLVPDKNGRILIPRRYLEMAGIEDEVLFHGLGETIEIWSAREAGNLARSQQTLGADLQQLMA